MPRSFLPVALATLLAMVVPAVGINLSTVKLDAGDRRLTPDGFSNLGEIYGSPGASFSPNTEFGTSVRLSSADGSRLAVGAVQHDWSTPYVNQSRLSEDCGGVFLYEQVDNDWNLTWFVSGNRHERIGDRISLSEDGSRIAIRRNNPNGVDIYDVTATFKPIPVVTLFVEDDGAAVTLSPDGSRIFVSSDRYNDFTGRVEIFKDFNGVWAPTGFLDGLDFHDRFGWMTAVSSNGNRLAVSAPNYEDDRGLVQVFDYSPINNKWVQIGLDIEGDVKDEKLGFSMDMSGDGSTLIIASPGSDMFGNDFGKVSVYEITSDGWVLKGQPIGGATEDDKYGRSVAISEDGNRIAASSYRRNTRSGVVEMFDFLDGEWVSVGSDIDGEEGTPRLGYGLLSVSMTGDGRRLAAGSVRSLNGDGDSTGLARIFGTPPRSSAQPSDAPSLPPSASPSLAPSTAPSKEPSERPSASPSYAPSQSPSASPTLAPSVTPSEEPSASPSATPSHSPSSSPSSIPTNSPSETPSLSPSATPSFDPTLQPSAAPSVSVQPSLRPSVTPSVSVGPSSSPSENPTMRPSGVPTVAPSTGPTDEPSPSPTFAPSESPTLTPTTSPSKEPTESPTATPSHMPTDTPSSTPTEFPSKFPSVSPTATPSVGPTIHPSGAPSVSAQPSLRPSAAPSASAKPSSSPSGVPTTEPTGMPTNAPSRVPSDKPSVAPSSTPSATTAAPNVIPQANSPGSETSAAGKNAVSLIATLIVASVGVALF